MFLSLVQYTSKQCSGFLPLTECSPLPCVFVPPAVCTDCAFFRLRPTAACDGAHVKPV